MTQSIPASAIVSATPSVLSAGGSALDLSGLVLSAGTRVPTGTVLSFPSAKAVDDYFGPTSDEAQIASIYFNGFNGSNVKPGAIWFAQYNEAAVSAYLRGGNISGLTLAQLHAIPAATLTVVSDGVAETSGTITLSGASSFSNAATIIQAAFTTPSFGVTYDSVAGAFVLTTTATGPSATMAFATSTDASATSCSTTGTVLTIGGSITGSFKIGDVVSGTQGGNSLPAGTTIVKQLTGSTPGGAGTYTISAAGSPSDLGTFTCTSTGPTGALAVSLMLTAATGAVLSQGAAIAVPATLMGTIVDQTTDWASFMTVADPDGGSGNTLKQAFAAWTNTQGNRYAYVAWDTDITPTESTAATTSLGYLLKQSASSGTMPIWGPDYTKAAFVLGAIASLDFTEHNGRATMAFKAQSGLSADVTSQTAAPNLIANGYNFYGAYATANDRFTFLNPGSISGAFEWADSYVNQIWLNNAFQLALMALLANVKSIPYSNSGYALIRAACLDPIKQGLNFGAFVPGEPLSSAQIAEVNNAAGLAIDSVLSSQGWYLQISPALPQVRAARRTPPMTFWYMDGGSVQQINLASVEVQ